MTRGDLVFDEAKDFVDVAEGVVWVEVSRAGKTERIDLAANDDWVDARIFSCVQEHLASTGSRRRFAVHSFDGQDCLIVCQTADTLKVLNRVTGLRFEEIT